MEAGVVVTGMSMIAVPPRPVQISRVTPVPAARIWIVSVEAPVP